MRLLSSYKVIDAKSRKIPYVQKERKSRENKEISHKKKKQKRNEMNIPNTFCIVLYTCDCEYFDIFEWWCYLSIFDECIVYSKQYSVQLYMVYDVVYAPGSQYFRVADSTRTMSHCRFTIPTNNQKKKISITNAQDLCRISSKTYKSHWRISFFVSVRFPCTAQKKQEEESGSKTERER